MTEPAVEVVIRRMRQRRDTAANWTAKNPVLDAGEIGFETQPAGAPPLEKVGDGATAWLSLPYRSTTLQAKGVSFANLDDALRAGVVRRYVTGTAIVVGELYLSGGHLYEALVAQASAPAAGAGGALDTSGTTPKFRDVSGAVDLSKLLALPTSTPSVQQVATVSPVNGAPVAGYRNARDIAEDNAVVSEKYRNGKAPELVSGLVTIDMADKVAGRRTPKITPTGPVQLSPTNVDDASLSTATVVVVQGDPAYTVKAPGAAAQDAVDETPGAKIVLSFLCLGDGTFTMRAIETIKVVTYADRMRATSPGVWLPLGDLQGTVAADSSGNGRNGVYVNSPTLGQTSLVGVDTNGRSVLFDGVDDRIDIDALATAGIFDPGKDFTVGFLMKPQGAPAVVTTPPQVRNILSVANVTTGAETSTLLTISAQNSISYDRMRFLWRNSQGGVFADTSTTVTPYDVSIGATWAVFWVYDATAKTLKPFYANFGMTNPASAGPTANVATLTGGTFTPTGATIGARRVAGGIGNFYPGLLGPFMVWPRALTATDMNGIWADWKAR